MVIAYFLKLLPSNETIAYINQVCTVNPFMVA